MAAAAPSHRMHSAFGHGSSSRYGHASHMSSAQASWNRIPNVCAPRRPSSGYEFESSPVLARTTPASLSARSSTGLGLGGGLGLGFGAGSSASGSRPRRTTISYGSPAPTRRAPPPPPAPAERTASALASSIAHPPALPRTIAIPEIDDPFADPALSSSAFSSHSVLEDELTPLPPPPPPVLRAPRSRVSVPSYTMSVSGAGSSGSGVTTPPGLGAPSCPSARDMRGRLVASVLLSRGSGRPLGVYLRRRLAGEGQTYVKSGLSQLVAAAA